MIVIQSLFFLFFLIEQITLYMQKAYLFIYIKSVLFRWLQDDKNWALVKDLFLCSLLFKYASFINKDKYITFRTSYKHLNNT